MRALRTQLPHFQMTQRNSESLQSHFLAGCPDLSKISLRMATFIVCEVPKINQITQKFSGPLTQIRGHFERINQRHLMSSERSKNASPQPNGSPLHPISWNKPDASQPSASPVPASFFHAVAYLISLSLLLICQPISGAFEGLIQKAGGHQTRPSYEEFVFLARSCRVRRARRVQSNAAWKGVGGLNLGFTEIDKPCFRKFFYFHFCQTD